MFIRKPHLLPYLGCLLFALAAPLHALDPALQQDAYSLGMGQADSAIVGGTHAIPLNPAGVARANQPMAQLGLGLLQPGNDLGFNTSVLYPMTDGTVFALSQSTQFSSSSISRTTYLATAALPLNAARDFFFGINLKYLALSTLNNGSVDLGRGLGLDIGFAYDLRRPEGTLASFALAIQDMSTEVRFNDTYDLSVPRTFILGAAYQAIQDTRIELDYQIVDQTLQNTALHNRLRLGAERFFQDRNYSVRLGYDDLLDNDGAFSLGAGYHPAQPFEVTYALRGSTRSGELSHFLSFVYRFDNLFKSAPVVERPKADSSSEINIGSVEELVEVPSDTGKPVSSVPLHKMAIGVDPKIFSPAGRQKTTLITFPNDSRAGVARWLVLIQDDQKRTIRRLGGTGPILPGFVWDGHDEEGRPVKEGAYTVNLRSYGPKHDLWSDDTETVEVLLPRSRFEIQAASGYFSPKAGKKGRAELVFTVNAGGSSSVQSWDFEISDSSDQKVVYEQQGKNRLPKSLKWNGKDLQNTVVGDGKYLCLLTAQDRAGNSIKSDAVQVTVDATAPEIGLKCESAWVDPAQHGKVRLFLSAADKTGIQGWKLTWQDEGKRTLKTYDGSGQPPQDLTWDGVDETGKAVPGGTLMRASFSATDKAGNPAASETIPVQVDYHPPASQEQLTLNLTTLYFNAQSSKLTEYARKDLDKAAGSIKSYLHKSVLVVKGYASPAETGDLLVLSHERALEVKKYLIKSLGLTDESVFAVGYADQESKKTSAPPLTEDPQRRAVITLTTVR